MFNEIKSLVYSYQMSAYNIIEKQNKIIKYSSYFYISFLLLAPGIPWSKTPLLHTPPSFGADLEPF